MNTERLKEIRSKLSAIELLCDQGRALLDEISESLPDREYDRVDIYIGRAYVGLNDCKTYIPLVGTILGTTRAEQELICSDPEAQQTVVINLEDRPTPIS